MPCVCKICGKPADCGDMLCPVCDLDYSDEIYHCNEGHCDVNLKTIAQRIRRLRETRKGE